MPTMREIYGLEKSPFLKNVELKKHVQISAAGTAI